MISMTVVILAVLIVLVLGFIWGYNRLVRLKSMMQEAWSGIDVQLKRRYDLIPNLVDIVKGYAGHEKDLLQDVVKLRAASMGATDIKDKEEAEVGLVSSLKTLFAVAEQYPDLKANENFLALQKELSDVEEELQFARRYYNGAARNYNVAVLSFPLNLIANRFSFGTAEYFNVSAKEREIPSTKF